jgi:hypothetical protein
MLSNVNADKNQLLQIILIGQLKDILRSSQPAVCGARLVGFSPMRSASDKQDVVPYIDYRLAAVGSESNLFSDSTAFNQP